MVTEYHIRINPNDGDSLQNIEFQFHIHTTDCLQEDYAANCEKV
jgi:hypothetical protein